MLDLSTVVPPSEDASDDPADLEESPVTIRGNLEGTNQGSVFGWVYNESDINDKQRISIYENQACIAEGIANQYRSDLEDAGIGDGHCAFNIPLPDELFDGVSHELTAVVNDTEVSIGSLYCAIPPFAGTFVKSVESGILKGLIEIHVDVSLDTYVIEVLVDNAVEAESHSYPTATPNQHAVIVELPTRLLDDNYHLYSLRVKNKGTTSEPHYAKLESISTRWQYIGESFSTLNVSALPKIAAYRYRSLQEHLRSAKSQPDSIAMTEVQRAHDIVVEGFHFRKQFPTLTLPAVDKPVVTVVIPVHNAFEYTYNCIASLILAHNKLSFEVVLIDDASTDRTLAISEHINNLRVHKNEKNLGFLRTAQNGASIAKGEYLVFLNNDTEVTSGWIDRLHDVFQRFDNVGLAGSKLIYPNGKLQEAGGLIWNNGKPWNVGNGENPEDPIYNYVRHADYVSGAAMMVRKSTWEAVDGFSDEFIPAYYEDTDLAFKVREAGFKTLYVPSSVVVHYEGMSNGRDLDSGYKRYQTVNAPQFRQKWRHAYKHHGSYGKAIEMEFDRNKDFRVLMVDHSIPKPDQDAGSYAAVQEMRILQELGCKITFVPNNMAHMGKYTAALQDEGIECLHAPFYRNVGEVLRARGEEFDLVYITRYNVAEEILEYVRQYSKAKIVLNNADLHFLREMRAAAQADTQTISSALKTRERELAVMGEVDAILSYNDTEHSVISSHTFETTNIFKCPWVLRKKPLRVPFNQRRGISFLGGFSHLPNREAVTFFVKEVMPLIRQQNTGIEFSIYGSAITEEIEQLATNDVHVKGFVESLDTLFDECRVFVAPLLSGAGIKGKVLESVSYQVPCVLSPIAAESTGLVDGMNARIAMSPEEWADAIISLYNDEAEWTRLSQKALELVQERYSIEHGMDCMSKMMSYLELDPAAHRVATFKTT